MASPEVARPEHRVSEQDATVRALSDTVLDIKDTVDQHTETGGHPADGGPAHRGLGHDPADPSAAGGDARGGADLARNGNGNGNGNGNATGGAAPG